MTAAEAVQEGSRWINGRPSGDDFSKWFTGNVKLHENMDASKYLTGIVLISGKEKHKVAKQAENGSIVIVEEERLVHTPYAKVETRVAYFWDLMAMHDEWVGVIEPGPVNGKPIEGLPPGFFRMAVTRPDAKVVNFVCSTMRVRILQAGTVKTTEQASGSPRMGVDRSLKIEGVPVAEFPPAVKMIPSVDRWGNEDPFALMKAETGAVGRALGMAGMLVIPGSGVATAEDMQEAQAHEPSLGSDADVEAQAQAQAEVATGGGEKANPTVDMLTEIEGMIERLREEQPEKMQEIEDWAKERRLKLSELASKPEALRGIHRKLKAALTAE